MATKSSVSKAEEYIKKNSVKSGFNPPPEVVDQIDVFLRHNAKTADRRNVYGAERVRTFLNTECGVRVCPDTLREWMRNRSKQLGLTK